VMLAPGSRAAAADQQHPRDFGCSVRVARGPADRPETRRPAGKARPPDRFVIFGDYEVHCAQGIPARCLVRDSESRS
jgi:hypothetical protein